MPSESTTAPARPVAAPGDPPAPPDALRLFASLDARAAHREWDDYVMSRDFSDPTACPLCRAGWCVQRMELGPPVGVIIHGLALH